MVLLLHQLGPSNNSMLSSTRLLRNPESGETTPHIVAMDSVDPIGGDVSSRVSWHECFQIFEERLFAAHIAGRPNSGSLSCDPLR